MNALDAGASDGVLVQPQQVWMNVGIAFAMPDLAHQL
jgi:hypothetical protein